MYLVLLFLALPTTIFAQSPVPSEEKPRVFITDSQSWEMVGHAGGTGGTFGAESHGGARPQTAEIIKTFGEKCPGVMVNNIQSKANYIVVLDHEGGKGYLRHRNKVAVFDARSGDAVVSKSTLSLGGSVDEGCRGIMKHWAEHGVARGAMPAAATPEPKSLTSPTPAEVKQTGQLSVSSTPDGADIEVDGNFVGNTPSSLSLQPGSYTISVKKAGYKAWERKLKVSGGDVRLKADLEKEN